MIPPTAAVLTAFLTLGGLDLVGAQDLKPRFVPKQFKRQINYRALSTPSANPRTSELANNPNTNVPQPTETGEAVTTAPVADPSPVVVIPITLSVDLNGVTHTITGTPPAATPGAVTSTSATSITEQPPPPPASTPTVSPAPQTQESTPVPVPQPTERETTSLATPTESSQDVTETPSSVQPVPAPSSTGSKLSDASESSVSTSGSVVPVAPATPTDLSSETTPANSKPAGSSVPIIDTPTTTDVPPSQKPDDVTAGLTNPSTPVEVAPSSGPSSFPTPGLVPGLLSGVLGGTSSSTDLASTPTQSESSNALSSTDSPSTPSQSDSIPSPTDILRSTDGTLTPSRSDSSIIASSTDLSQSGSSSIPIIDSGASSTTASRSQNSEDNATRSTGSITPTHTESASAPTGAKTSNGASSTGSDASSSSGLFPTIPISVPVVTPPASSDPLDVTGALSTALGITSPALGTPTSSFQPGPSGSSATSALIPGGSISNSKTGTQDATESQSASASQSATATLSSSGSLGTSGPSAPTSGPVIPTGTKSGSAGLSSTALISTKPPSAGSTNPATPIPTTPPAPSSTQQPTQPGTTQPSTQQPPQSSTSQPSTQQPPQPSTTQPPVETTPTPAPVPEPTPEPTTQVSTSSDDNDWVPSTILVEPPTPTTHESATSATATATGTQPQLPGQISPNGGNTRMPENAVQIRIGFDERLRYSFVATTMLSSTQIFHYVPIGLQYALGLSYEQIKVHEIRPLEMHGYIATTILVWVSRTDYLWNLENAAYNRNETAHDRPATKINSQFEIDYITPPSRIYHQPDQSVNTLFSMIDDTISIWPNGTPDADGKTHDKGPNNSNDDDNGSGSDNNGDGGASSSAKARPSSVGIGVGVVAGAAAYGAGMFWVARRYRRKRQLHQRSSSTVEQMSEGRGGGPVFATGGRMSRNSQVSRGGSARTQMISAPVMAENSLGWN